jgi:hypothetical protein
MTISHTLGVLRVSFDSDELAIRRWPGDPVSISWSEVEFVCPTPTMVRTKDGWTQRTYGLAIESTFKTTLETHGHLWLEVVLRDRRPLLARATGWTGFWLRRHVSPLLGASDRPRPDQSVISLDLYRRRLSGSLDELLHLLSAVSRFDLVCHFD